MLWNFYNIMSGEWNFPTDGGFSGGGRVSEFPLSLKFLNSPPLSEIPRNFNLNPPPETPPPEIPHHLKPSENPSTSMKFLQGGKGEESFSDGGSFHARGGIFRWSNSVGVARFLFILEAAWSYAA